MSFWTRNSNGRLSHETEIFGKLVAFTLAKHKPSDPHWLPPVWDAGLFDIKVLNGNGGKALRIIFISIMALVEL